MTGPRARVSQLKMKLKKRNEEITEGDIADLKAQCAQIRNISCVWGDLRGLSIKQLLQALMPVVDEPYPETNLTFTSAKKRKNLRCFFV